MRLPPPRDIQDEQFHFEESLHELEDEIMNFVNFTDLNDAQTINDQAIQITERLKNSADQAKQYNLKE